MTRRIPIDQLQVGMFVTGFDRSWFRTPFLRHRFLIRSSDDIKKLGRSGINEVVIDTERGCDLPDDGRHTAGEPPIRRPQVDAVSGLPRGVDRMRQDIALAMEVRRKLEQTVHCLFDNMTATGVVNVEEAHEAAQEISIATRTLNSQALFMAMSQVPNTTPALSQHTMATCTLAMMLGQAMEFSLTELQELAVGALLHDIGLLQVPAPLLQRLHNSSRPLGDAERAQHEGHAKQGAIDLERQGGFSLDVRRILAEHHALPNGRGFPSEINPQWISTSSRIVMIADTYDDLLRGFGGRTPAPPHEALHRLYQQAREGALDFEITSLFVKRVGVFPIYSTVELNTGERGIVVGLNPAHLHLPIVVVTHSPHGDTLISPISVDLLQQNPGAPSRSIVRVLKSGAIDPAMALSPIR